MHDGEIVATAEQMRALLRSQFPAWADREITPLPLLGTDHALFRLGTDLVARMPRMESVTDQSESDARWLPILAPHVPLALPVPLALGEPGAGYPWPWSVVEWIDGETPTATNLDLEQAAADLAAFLVALRGVDPTGGFVKAGTMRGAPLANRDEQTRAAIAALGDPIDQQGVRAAWDASLAAKPWSDELVWLHGDLLPGNLIVRDRRLVAVIDFGALGIGDPAVDLQPAWKLFDAPARAVFREAMGLDDDAWERGRGWSLSLSVVGLEYYWDRMPRFADGARRELDALLGRDKMGS